MGKQIFNIPYDKIDLSQPSSIVNAASDLVELLLQRNYTPIRKISVKIGPQQIAYARLFCGDAYDKQVNFDIPLDEVGRKKLCAVLFTLHKRHQVDAEIHANFTNDIFATKHIAIAGPTQKGLEDYISKTYSLQPAPETKPKVLPPLEDPYSKLEKAYNISPEGEPSIPSLSETKPQETPVAPRDGAQEIYNAGLKLVESLTRNTEQQALDIKTALLALLGQVHLLREQVLTLEARLLDAVPPSEVEKQIQLIKAEYDQTYIPIAEYQKVQRERTAVRERLAKLLLAIREAEEPTE